MRGAHLIRVIPVVRFSVYGKSHLSTMQRAISYRPASTMHCESTVLYSIVVMACWYRYEYGTWITLIWHEWWSLPPES